MEREVDETSSRNEHSEGEDSIYNYGTDDEANIDFNCYKNVHYYQETNAKNENPLLISSSVAFGSEDWDDFVHQSEGKAFGSAFLMRSFLWNWKEHKAEIDNLMTLDGLPPACQTDRGKTVEDMPIASVHVQDDNKIKEVVDSSSSMVGFLKVGELEETEHVRDFPVDASCQVQTAAVLIEFTGNSFTIRTNFSILDVPEQEDKRAIPFTNHQTRGAHELADYAGNCSLRNVSKIDRAPLAGSIPENNDFNSLVDVTPNVRHHINTEEAIKADDSQVVGHKGEDKSKVKSNPLANVTTSQPDFNSTLSLRNIGAKLLEDFEPKAKPSTFVNTMIQNTCVPVNHIDDHPASVKTENFELKEFYDEVVHEMEEILLDTSESPGFRFLQGNRILQSKQSLPLRDGGTSASTSGAEDSCFFPLNPLRIDWVEVVGARQKKGDVSFSERLVG